MGFSRQEYRGWLPFPPPGDLPDSGTEPTSLMSLALAGRFFTTSTAWEAHFFPLYLTQQAHCGQMTFVMFNVSGNSPVKRGQLNIKERREVVLESGLKPLRIMKGWDPKARYRGGPQTVEGRENVCGWAVVCKRGGRRGRLPG